jgi:hypothetical protein
MILTNRFVVLHMPKTGGVFLEHVCEEHLPATWLVNHALHRHARWEEIPDAYRELPVFYAVRNPWDWYVSWFDHVHRGRRDFDYKEQKPFWQTAFAEGKNDFRQTIVNACTGSIAHELTPIPPGSDYYSARFRWIGGAGLASGRVEVGRFETLREDFLAFLQRHDVPLPDGFADAVARFTPVNVGERGPYRDYYDEETRALVGEKTREIVERYGYEF